jgi:hypothetical protein
MDGPAFSARDGRLHVEELACTELAARFGTPLYVMSETRLRSNVRRLGAALAAGWPLGEARLLPSIKADTKISYFSLGASLRRVLREFMIRSDMMISLRSGQARRPVAGYLQDRMVQELRRKTRGTAEGLGAVVACRVFPAGVRFEDQVGDPFPDDCYGQSRRGAREVREYRGVSDA